jgi:hypothetical protein
MDWMFGKRFGTAYLGICPLSQLERQAIMFGSQGLVSWFPDRREGCGRVGCLGIGLGPLVDATEGLEDDEWTRKNGVLGLSQAGKCEGLLMRRGFRDSEVPR